MENKLAATVTALGSKINDIICVGNDVEVMFNDDHSMPLFQ